MLFAIHYGAILVFNTQQMRVIKWKFDGKVRFMFKETHQEKGMIVT